jgi:hypothetical protein
VSEGIVERWKGARRTKKVVLVEVKQGKASRKCPSQGLKMGPPLFLIFIDDDWKISHGLYSGTGCIFKYATGYNTW